MYIAIYSAFGAYKACNIYNSEDYLGDNYSHGAVIKVIVSATCGFIAL